MQIICFNCKNTWEVPAAHILGARLKFGPGFREYAFICPKCEMKNLIMEEEFLAADRTRSPIPVTGTRSQAGTIDESQHSKARIPGGAAPTNPVEGPIPWNRQRQGVVRVRGLEARRDHSSWSEVVGAFSKGEKLTILGAWTDGENTWAQLGPERWINIEQDGEASIDLIDD